MPRATWHTPPPPLVRRLPRPVPPLRERPTVAPPAPIEATNIVATPPALETVNPAALAASHPPVSVPQQRMRGTQLVRTRRGIVESRPTRAAFLPEFQTPGIIRNPNVPLPPRAVRVLGYDRWLPGLSPQREIMDDLSVAQHLAQTQEEMRQLRPELAQKGFFTNAPAPPIPPELMPRPGYGMEARGAFGAFKKAAAVRRNLRKLARALKQCRRGDR
jgi:hypothetical protein